MKMELNISHHLQKKLLKLIPELFVKAWGYNCSVPVPTIIVKPNDKVCIRVIAWTRSA
ncbi:hypothetical protein [Clostridium neonatale]|nr:hypothetical protein [Clostridium neonatale]